MISPHMPKIQMLTLIEALKANDGDWSRIPSWTAATAPQDLSNTAIDTVPDTVVDSAADADPSLGE